MTRILFLDFDGVLNSTAYFRANRGKAGGPALEPGALDRQAVERLNAIVEATGAEVVVSSSWRLHYSTDQICELLTSRGFRGVVRDTTGTAGRERGDEIRAWLDEHPEVTAYAVLDDYGDMEAVRDHHVRTDFATGLTADHAKRCIAMLGGAT